MTLLWSEWYPAVSVRHCTRLQVPGCGFGVQCQWGSPFSSPGLVLSEEDDTQLTQDGFVSSHMMARCRTMRRPDAGANARTEGAEDPSLRLGGRDRGGLLPIHPGPRPDLRADPP